MPQDRYIYAAPTNREFGGASGTWKVWASSKDGEWTPETYNTRKQAIKAMSAYAKLLGWERGSYRKSVDE